MTSLTGYTKAGADNKFETKASLEADVAGKIGTGGPLDDALDNVGGTVLIAPGGTVQQSTLTGTTGGSADGVSIIWWQGPAQTNSNSLCDLYSQSYLGSAVSADTSGQLGGSVSVVNPAKIQVVVHSQNGNRPRPSVASGVVVWWFGPAYPVHAAPTDIWTGYHIPTQFSQGAASPFNF